MIILGSVFVLTQTNIGRSLRASVGLESRGACYQEDGSCKDDMEETFCKSPFSFDFGLPASDTTPLKNYWVGGTTCNENYKGIITTSKSEDLNLKSTQQKTPSEVAAKCLSETYTAAREKCANPKLVSPFSERYLFKFLETGQRSFTAKPAPGVKIKINPIDYLYVRCGMVIECTKPEEKLGATPAYIPPIASTATPTTTLIPLATLAPTPTTAFIPTL